MISRRTRSPRRRCVAPGCPLGAVYVDTGAIIGSSKDETTRALARVRAELAAAQLLVGDSAGANIVRRQLKCGYHVARESV